jgi:ABC-type multidrug transport system, ATPase component
MADFAAHFKRFIEIFGRIGRNGAGKTTRLAQVRLK